MPGSGDASIQRYSSPDRREAQDTQGITQFGATGGAWNQVIGGLTIQGGNAVAAGRVNFSIAIQKQVLGVFLQGGTVSAVDNRGFTASAAGYWFAIGA